MYKHWYTVSTAVQSTTKFYTSELMGRNYHNLKLSPNFVFLKWEKGKRKIHLIFIRRLLIHTYYTAHCVPKS